MIAARQFADGSAYNAEKVRKVMIIMTDGANYWEDRPRTVGGSEFQALGYYSFNGAINTTLPTASNGSTTNYQTQLAGAAPDQRKGFQEESRNA